WTGGSQDPDASPSADWFWAYGQTNDKGNIQNAGAILLINPNNNHKILYFFGDRTADNGDAQIGFWFFLDDVHPIGTGATKSNFTGEHKNGDILIISNFANGGGNVDPTVYIWKNKTANNPGGLVLLTAADGVDTAMSSNNQNRNVPNVTMFNGE